MRMGLSLGLGLARAGLVALVALVDLVTHDALEWSSTVAYLRAMALNGAGVGRWAWMDRSMDGVSW